LQSSFKYLYTGTGKEYICQLRPPQVEDMRQQKTMTLKTTCVSMTYTNGVQVFKNATLPKQQPGKEEIKP
jgi:hypothetical protein